MMEERRCDVWLLRFLLQTQLNRAQAIRYGNMGNISGTSAIYSNIDEQQTVKKLKARKCQVENMKITYTFILWDVFLKRVNLKFLSISNLPNCVTCQILNL